MADWRDGAEYAPTERPDGFATPRTEPLETPPPRSDLAARAPLQQPAGFQPSQAPVAPLDALVPAAKEPPRNPHQPFDSSAEPANTTAWGAAHASFNPRAPMAVDEWNGAAPWGHGGSTAAFAPPTGAPVAAPPMAGMGAPAMPPYPMPGLGMATGDLAAVPANEFPANESFVQRLRRLMGLVGFGYYIVLALAVVVNPLSILLLLSSIVFAIRAKIAKVKLQRFTGVAVCIALFAGLVFNRNSDALDSLNGWAQIISAVTFLGSLLLVGAADADSRRPGGPPPGPYGPPPIPPR